MKNDESQELWGVFSKSSIGELYLVETADCQDDAEDIALEAVKLRGVDRYVFRLVPCCKFSSRPNREPL